MTGLRLGDGESLYHDNSTNYAANPYENNLLVSNVLSSAPQQEDMQSVHSYSSSRKSSPASSTTRSNKRATKLETKATTSKFTKKSTSIYRKNKELRQLADNFDNESCSSSALLAAALDDLAIA